MREEGEHLGLGRVGSLHAGWAFSGFLKEELLVCAETARCESAHYSSSLITALLEDKTRPGMLPMCVQHWKTCTNPHI